MSKLKYVTRKRAAWWFKRILKRLAKLEVPK